MLSNKQAQKCYEVFEKLPGSDRKLLALKSICTEMDYFEERRFVQALIKSGFKDETGQPFTVSLYQAHVSQLKQKKLAGNTSFLTVPKALRHGFLLLLSSEESRWVFAMVDGIYDNQVTDFSEKENPQDYLYEEKAKIKSQLTKSLYANEADYFLVNQNNLIYSNAISHYLQDILGNTVFDVEWLKQRHEVIQWYLCVLLLKDFWCEASPAPNRKEILTLFCQTDFSALSCDFLHYYSAIIYLTMGDMDKATIHHRAMKNPSSGLFVALEATFALCRLELKSASTLFRNAMTALRKQYKSPTYMFDNFISVFYGLCLAYVDKNLAGLETTKNQFIRYSANHLVAPMEDTYQLLPLIKWIEEGKQEQTYDWLSDCGKNLARQATNPLVFAVYHLLCYMTNKEHLDRCSEQINLLLEECIKLNQVLAARILYELFEKSGQYSAQANEFLQKHTMHLRVLDLIQIKAEWEYSFQALEGLLLDGVETVITTKSKRLLWLLDPINQDIEVVEQSQNKSGSWTPGRSISLKKLKHYNQNAQFDYVSQDDKAVLECIISSNDYWNEYYQFDEYRAILALIGHRHVVHHQNRDVSIELVRVEPELYIEENQRGYQLSLSHWLPHAGLIIESESLNKYRVIDFSAVFANIGQVLTKNGLIIPVEAKEKIIRVIQHAKRDIKIHVSINDIDIPELPGDPTLCIQLLPIKDGIRASLWVRPLVDQGSYCKIAHGKEHMMAVLTENGDEKRTRVVRDFAIEKQNLAELLKKCPSLGDFECEQGEYEMDNPTDTLDVLSELQRYASAQPLNIEWPQGQNFKIKQKVLYNNLSLKINSENNWFEYEGEVTLDDGEVLSMQVLLESIAAQSYGRFVRLGNGEFIELTSQLKKQLSVLHAISDGNKINPLGAQILSEIAQEAEQAIFDEGWQEYVKKVKKMKSHSPKVPSTLQASLRDYQVEGFRYLSRLTHWGIGACLADDMGLGKTIQTIALLLERAKKGASLVIAPTSVSFNWIDELIKFAPTLNVYNLRSDDKVTLVDKAGKFDVVICSYGLLQHHDELLTGKQWETVVLDEAQAIKNANTLRWKAVMKLKANNRIALSGTPIENHLGELWSIFSFINPGLLGSIKSFQHKYSGPIESSEAPDRAQALKKLVSPYILRRLKSEVLNELPPKTEQTIYVEQSKEEAAFYEALRLKAQERMVQFMEENNRIGVLAEITKLRQACCDSSLIENSVSIDNSKLNAFIETVKNIIDNGHKALVFSQYVSFLQIVRNRIEKERIVYQYLDGSTPVAKRKQSVDAFQNGEGDLFLLSLKAGGSGLNLTAADYVIHLDPWWNPAVEDQASDRAHRIGQERPVTIYRFIMQNTIEEKIINMHQKKRDLANELLSGQGISGKLSNSDLMNLIVPK